MKEAKFEDYKGIIEEHTWINEDGSIGFQFIPIPPAEPSEEEEEEDTYQYTIVPIPLSEWTSEINQETACDVIEDLKKNELFLKSTLFGFKEKKTIRVVNIFSSEDDQYAILVLSDKYSGPPYIMGGIKN